MAGTGRLQADPLFLGLARPTMIMGVNYLFFVVNAVINLIAFINTGNFMVLIILAPFTHIVAYLICLKEPRAIELIMLKMQKGLKCLNRRFHGHTNSYDIY